MNIFDATYWGHNHENSKKDLPAAACPCCGGWTSFGGMSQHSKSAVPVSGRTGCGCTKPNKPLAFNLVEV